MAVGVAALATDNQRKEWAKALLLYASQRSAFMPIFSPDPGSSSPGIISSQVSGLTFTVEAFGPIVGDSVPYGAALVDNTAAVQMAAVVGTRYPHAQAAAYQKYIQSMTPRDIAKHCVKELGMWWARQFDIIAVHALSLGQNTVTATTTTPATYQAYFTGLGDTSTAGTFKYNVNQANIGTIALGSTLGDKNVFFAGDDPDTGGPRTTVAENTWATAMHNTPENFRIDVSSIGWLKEYALSRHIPPLNSDPDNTTSQEDPEYILFLPTIAIKELREDPTFRAAISGTQASVDDLQTGRMRMMIDGVELRTIRHNVGDLTANTALRAEASADNKHNKYEGILVGRQAVAMSQYDNDFSVGPANEDDFGRTPKFGGDIIIGMQKTKRVYTTSSSYVRENVASFCFTTRKLG